MLPEFETKGLVKLKLQILAVVSTKQTRRRFNAEFKVKVVLEALKERSTLAELSHKCIPPENSKQTKR